MRPTLIGPWGACLLVLLLVAATLPGCQFLLKDDVEDKPAVEVPVDPPAEIPAPPPVEEPPPPAKKQVDDKVPEIDEVSLVEPGQPEPRLLPEEEKAEVTAEALREHIREAERLSSTLDQRELSPDLKDQVKSGRAFLGDARKAIRARVSRRCPQGAGRAGPRTRERAARQVSRVAQRRRVRQPGVTGHFGPVGLTPVSAVVSMLVVDSGGELDSTGRQRPE